MKIRRIKRAGATVGLVFAVVLVTFTLGLAQDGAPSGLSHSFGFQRGVADDASCLGDHLFQEGLAPKPADSSVSWARNWPQAVLPPSLFAANAQSISTVIRPGKISLYLLDLILLI